MKKKQFAVAVILLAAAVLGLLMWQPWVRSSGILVVVDGEAYDPAASVPSGDLQVHLTFDGKEIAAFPFDEAHTVRVLQENGDENTLVLTGESVYMESANCEGQDCVHMEEVTRDNLETRVMFGMIICLPHRLSVEVR